MFRLLDRMTAEEIVSAIEDLEPIVAELLAENRAGAARLVLDAQRSAGREVFIRLLIGSGRNREEGAAAYENATAKPKYDA